MYLGNLKKKSISPHITIIITEKGEISKWNKELKLNCPLLETLVLNEHTDI